MYQWRPGHLFIRSITYLFMLWIKAFLLCFLTNPGWKVGAWDQTTDGSTLRWNLQLSTIPLGYGNLVLVVYDFGWSCSIVFCGYPRFKGLQKEKFYSPELSLLIDALNWSLVPIDTAWSTGTSFSGICSSFAASLNKATSYSRGPGDSSTTPETLAAGGLKLYWQSLNDFF